MKSKEFNILSKRYLAGECTPAEEALLLQWLDEQNEIEPTEISDEIGTKMWGKIEEKIPHKRHKSWAYWFSSAAAILLIAAVWYVKPEESINTNWEIVNQTGIQVKNTSRLDQEILLADGTIVQLKEGSTLVYSKNFNQEKREVVLFGEAFFKVKRNETKPFLVHTGDLVTEVLGTSFRIKSAKQASNIEVSVASGKVSVYSKDVNQNNERNGVIITRNQKVLYDLATKKITTSLVEFPKPVQEPNKPNAPFVFKDTPMQEVLALFRQQYGIEFLLPNPAAQTCLITADLNGLPFTNQLDLVCRSIDATYEKRGTVIFIQGGGCN